MSFRSPWIVRGIAAVVVGMLVIALVTIMMDRRTQTVIAYFPQAKGMYVGDDVTVLSVPVGQITAIDPQPDKVRVEMAIDHEQKLPADVRAAQVAGSLVSVRTIALGPVYEGGPTFVAGGTIPLSRTSIPVEWDEIKDQLVRLTAALGPTEADENGALSDLISSSAEFLDGNGADLQDTMTSLSEALNTLADNKGALFATVRNLQVFVAALEQSDADVRGFNTRLAGVSDILADNRDELTSALEELNGTFTEVQGFLKDNTDITTDTLSELRTITGILADNRQTLADLLQIAPGTISNFRNIEDPKYPALSGQVVFNSLSDPASFICTAFYAYAGEAGPDLCRQALGPLLDQFKIGAPPVGIRPPVNNGGGFDENDSTGAASTPTTDDADLIGSLLKGGR